MHKTTLIFGSAVVASVVVSYGLFNFLGSPNKPITPLVDANRTINLLVPLTDKNLTSAFVTYNIKTTIKKIEMTAKGTRLTLDNAGIPIAIATIDTSITSATPLKGIKTLLPKNLAVGQEIKLSLRQNLNISQDRTVTSIIILTPLSLPKSTIKSSSTQPIPTTTP